MFDFLLCDGNKMFGAAFPHPNLSNFPASPTFITWELLWDFCATNPGRICGIHNPRDIQSGRGQSSNLPCCKKNPQQILFKMLFLISLPARRWFLKVRNSRLCFPTRDWSRNWSRKFPRGWGERRENSRNVPQVLVSLLSLFSCHSWGIFAFLAANI